MIADWIAADWGTSRLRVWAMAAGGAALAAAESGTGMRGLRPGEFEGALLALVEDWLASGRRTPVVVCGMAGSREGWVHAPYCDLDTPLGAIATGAAVAPVTDPRLAVYVLPGLRQARPPDVMRGEETQLAGLEQAMPGFEGLVCLPGTHSKWARLAGGRVRWFHTYMTGELFDVLSRETVLRHSLAIEASDDGAFERAVTEAVAAPASWSRRLFGIRAASLVAGLGPDAGRATLSGLVIGLELADALGAVGNEPIVLVGGGVLARLYAKALAATGREARIMDGVEVTLNGLRAAHTAVAIIEGTRTVNDG